MRSTVAHCTTRVHYSTPGSLLENMFRTLMLCVDCHILKNNTDTIVGEHIRVRELIQDLI